MFTDLLNTVATRLYLAAKREEGQTFVEYTLIAALVGIGLILGLGAFKGDIASALNTIGGDL
jgi:Flp pilus assembly pilin Flp